MKVVFSKITAKNILDSLYSLKPCHQPSRDEIYQFPLIFKVKQACGLLQAW